MSEKNPEFRYLFVYGTLRAGAGTKWSQFLIAASRFVGPGRTRGALFRLDGYPGMKVLAEGDAWVTGEVYLLNTPSSTLSALDAYEGSEFERQIVPVLLEDGRNLEAWAYIYCPETATKPRIASGDYLRPES
jgi:gamma-glutamylaminecyclotransferase